MTQAAPGWYPDPSGDLTRQRFWDGDEWTDHYRDVDPNENAGFQEAPQAGAAESAPSSQQGAAPGPSSAGQPYANQQAQGAPTDTGQAAAGQAYAGQQAYAYGQRAAYTTYTSSAMSSTDRTLRLVAFIFCVISCVGFAEFIIPLAWMIPMTVISWKIYKGTRANTTAFGVCTLIFVSLVSGILLLCSTKDDEQAGRYSA
ncbi:MAG: DUF2510 domain-containing protein [Coriobacteriales bacterium]|jgi:hypothetical protein